VIAAPSGPLSVDVVALAPRYEPGAVPELKSRLQSLLAREVVVTMQQLLVAKDEEKDVVRSLAQLEQSLAAMKLQQSARDPATEFQNQLTTRIREQLGAVSLDTQSRTAVDVIGLASSDGQAARNLALAKARAEVVATWLVEHGISATVRPSFERKSQQPIERERGAAAFRRVEIIPLSGLKAASPQSGPASVIGNR